MPKLVILGAGYGGLALAQKLDTVAKGSSKWDVTLVDRRDYHLIQVRVHEVAANSISAERVKTPLAELLEGFKVNFVQAQIKTIDPINKKVHTDIGELDYDRLVVSLGSETAYFNIPGLQENTLPMKFLEDAIAFRKAVIHAFKTATEAGAAALLKNDPRLSIIIGGAGLTGTELAAEMVDFCGDLVKKFPAARGYYRIVLIEGKPHILPQLSASNGEYVRNELRLKGVMVLTNTLIQKVEPGKVYLNNEKVIRGSVISWTGGIRALPLIAESGFETTKDGRVKVDKFLRSEQYPEVYFIGDNAVINDSRNNGQFVPQNGQYAELQGNYLGEAFYQEERGQKPQPYVPFTLGTSISLGRREALTLSGPLRLTGIPGRIAKDVSYSKHDFDIRVKPRLLNPVKNDI